MKRRFVLIVLSLLLCGAAASCSNKGVHMPKHRKRTHCNCPTFSQERSAGDALTTVAAL